MSAPGPGAAHASHASGGRGYRVSMQQPWFRNAVVYAIDVAQFHDTDGDGWGDLRGVADRLEYVRGLGATCIWLLPFYRTPYRDGGYDVSDHLAVDPRFGDLADFALLMDKADSLGIRVLVDLVAQHTSVDHPWFQEARKDPSSPYRDYYVWADEPHESAVKPIFPTVEDSVWTWDEAAQQYYRHVFYSHEPDLDLGNPRVRDELERVMTFWMRLGVAGFRVDAVPYMVERARAADPTDDGLWLLEQMRDQVTLRRSDSVLMGEVDVPAKEYADYLGDGDRLTMLLNFWTDNHLFLALAREQAAPLVRALQGLPAAPRLGQYANFVRNHDELDLEQLTVREREEVIGAFAPDPAMLAYDRGVRRRLGPMLGDDEDRIAMVHALLASLPGAPVVLYGEEIGLPDDLSREERMAVRTPMKWSVVEDHLPRATSLLARVGHLLRSRAGRDEIGSGDFEVVDLGAPSVLCLVHRYEDSVLVTAVNLSADPVAFEVAVEEDLSPLVDILTDRDYPAASSGPVKLELGGYGYRWLLRSTIAWSE